MEIIELSSHKELPKGIEYVLYEPPYYGGEALATVISEFKRKYGSVPQTIYQLNHQLYVVKS